MDSVHVHQSIGVMNVVNKLKNVTIKIRHLANFKQLLNYTILGKNAELSGDKPDEDQSIRTKNSSITKT